MLKIIHAESAEELDHARRLLTGYAAELKVNPCFQQFDQELAGLPGKYAPPDGRLLLANYDGRVAGCVALHKIGEGICEMKRLYVPPDFRGKGIGRELASAIIQKARQIGYQRMYLDTLPSLKEALTLYQSLGFKRTEPYYHNPACGVVFMELDLKLVS